MLIIKNILQLHSFKGWLFAFLLLGVAVSFLPFLNFWLPEDSILYVPDYMFALIGKYLCYALVALAMDLIWGLYRYIEFRAWSIFFYWWVRHGNVFDEKYWQRGCL